MSKKEGTRKERVRIREKTPRTPEEKRGLIHKLMVFIGSACLVIVIAMMVAARFLSDIAILRVPGEMISSVLTPVQSFFSGFTGSVANYLQSLQYRSDLENKYQQDLAELEELKDSATRAQEYKKERDEIAATIADMNQGDELVPVRADVIGRDTGNYFSTFTVNRGTAHGVENDLAVTFGGGLVGYTYDVKENSASVRTIIDSDCTISALMESTRDQGTVRGSMGIDGQPNCRMYYLSEQHLPRAGDIVVTSGVGLEFLKGVPIGTVRESTRGLEDGKQYVVIEPTVDFSNIQYVTIHCNASQKANAASTQTPLSNEALETPSVQGASETPEAGGDIFSADDLTGTDIPNVSPSPTAGLSGDAPSLPTEDIRPEATAMGAEPSEPAASTAPDFNPDQLTMEDEVE